jgi:PTH2 family peptidyl-tRNA hydrolase
MDSERNVKQVIVIRRDLKMRRGKEIAQGAHASMAWLTERVWGSETSANAKSGTWLMYTTPAFTEAEATWLTGGFRKVTCQAQTEEELNDLYNRAFDLGVTAHLVTDAGLTEFGGVPTVTALAIGPDYDDRVDLVTGKLELY